MESERENQVSYINTNTQNLESQYQHSYLQGRKGDMDILGMVWKGDGGMI